MLSYRDASERSNPTLPSLACPLDWSPRPKTTIASLTVDNAQGSIAPTYQWNIRRMMAIIAGLAPLLALARYPFALGLFTFVGSISVFVTLSILRRRYDLVAWLLILYPALPLLVLFLHWNLATRKIVRRSTPFFDGLIGLSDFFGFLGIIAYFACIIIIVRSRSAPAIRRAARCVVYFVPITWTALFALAIWDPFGILAYFFRF